MHQRGNPLPLVLCAALCGLAGTGVHAVTVSLTDADFTRALSVGRSPDAERTRFHDRYRFPLQDATVESIEVVTELRRAVMVAEERRAFGDYMMGPRQLQDRIAALRGIVSVIAHLRFHPLNTFIFVPEYELSLGPPATPLPQLSLARSPIYQPPSGNPKDRAAAGGPIIAASIEAAYDAEAIGRQSLPVTLSLDGKSLVRLVIDFGPLD